MRLGPKNVISKVKYVFISDFKKCYQIALWKKYKTWHFHHQGKEYPFVGVLTAGGISLSLENICGSNKYKVIFSC